MNVKNKDSKRQLYPSFPAQTHLPYPVSVVVSRSSLFSFWNGVLLFSHPNWPYAYATFERFITVYSVSVLLHLLFVIPLHRMVHAFACQVQGMFGASAINLIISDVALYLRFSSVILQEAPATCQSNHDLSNHL